MSDNDLLFYMKLSLLRTVVFIVASIGGTALAYLVLWPVLRSIGIDTGNPFFCAAVWLVALVVIRWQPHSIKY